MLWVKSFHIFFVVSWFAGLFYLPRIYVNLAMLSDNNSAERDRLLLMAGKLFRFVTPIGVLALVTGTWLWLGYGFAGNWLYVKLFVTGLLATYHIYCGKLLGDFSKASNKRSHLWYRVFNEAPVLLLLASIILVTVKPF